MTFATMLSTMADGMLKTLLIFVLTLIGSLPLGMIVALLRKSRFAPVRGIISAYISIMRGTPLMLQLLLVYFGPYYLFGISTGNLGWGIFNYRLIATIIGFSLNYAAYFAEIFRGGIQSMPQGQYEASQVLGFTKAQTYFKIILPQVIKRVLPSVTNEVITLVKDTSLAQVLSVTEMFTVAKNLASAQVSVIPFIAAGLFYYLFNAVVDLIMNNIEKKMSYYS